MMIRRKSNMGPFVSICILTVTSIFLSSCQRVDEVAVNDFYIDLNNGNVTDSHGAYQTNVTDYTNLFITGGYIYVYGIIIYKDLDQSYYALSQYHPTDGCTVQYQTASDE